MSPMLWLVDAPDAESGITLESSLIECAGSDLRLAALQKSGADWTILRRSFLNISTGLTRVFDPIPQAC